MEIEQINNLKGFETYLVTTDNGSYHVDILDGMWRCECCDRYHRNPNIECKHRKKVIEYKKELDYKINDHKKLLDYLKCKPVKFNTKIKNIK